MSNTRRTILAEVNYITTKIVAIRSCPLSRITLSSGVYLGVLTLHCILSGDGAVFRRCIAPKVHCS